MNRLLPFLALGLLACAFRADAQTARALDGRVIDASSSTPVPDASVMIAGDWRLSRVTGPSGEFHFPVVIAGARLVAARIGFAPETVLVREADSTLLRLAPGLVIAQHAGGGKAEQIFTSARGPRTSAATCERGVPPSGRCSPRGSSSGPRSASWSTIS